jgi:tetratricopeptide (TPR) repeat protein
MKISDEDRNEILRDKFWRGLYSSELKNATMVSYQRGDSFEVLWKRARAEEFELKVAQRQKEELKGGKEEFITCQTNAVENENQSDTNIDKDDNDKLIRILYEKLDNLQKQLQEYKESLNKRDNKESENKKVEIETESRNREVRTRRIRRPKISKELYDRKRHTRSFTELQVGDKKNWKTKKSEKNST